jgi:HD-like signal output (HDOD) protein
MGTIGQMRSTVSTAGDRQFLASLYELLGERNLGLPDFPETPIRLDHLMNEEEPNSLQVMRCIESDPKLVGRVWQRARSARFPSSPSSLDMAVSRIGMVEVWRLSLESALDTLEIRPGIYKEMASVIRIHGAIVGDVAAGLLGQHRGPAFLCGLLHDVGQLLILQVASQGDPERSTVQRILDETHADLSVMVTDAWNLAPEIIPTVAYHHNPNAVNAGARDAVRLLCLADIAVDGELDRRAKKDSGFLAAMGKVTSSRALAGKAMLLAAQCIDRMEADGLK